MAPLWPHHAPHACPVATGRQHASGVFGVKLTVCRLRSLLARARLAGVLSVVQGFCLLLLLLCFAPLGTNEHVSLSLSAAQRTTRSAQSAFFSSLSPRGVWKQHSRPFFFLFCFVVFPKTKTRLRSCLSRLSWYLCPGYDMGDNDSLDYEMTPCTIPRTERSGFSGSF